MKCRSCNSLNTRVTVTEHKLTETRRYCRCLDCKAHYQTTETYAIIKRGSMFGIQQDNSRKVRGERISSAVLTEVTMCVRLESFLLLNKRTFKLQLDLVFINILYTK
jgi:hypothetical protein